MANRLLACGLALLMSAAMAFGLEIKGPESVDPYRLVRLKADVPEGAGCIWDFDEDRLDAVESGGSLTFTGPPGTYKVKLRVVTVSKDGKTQIETARTTVTIRGKVDPGPAPGPTPDPTPTPTPEPDAPIPAAGLRVLVVYESGELQKLPSKQVAIIYSQPLRTWLNAKCATGGDGKTREWRMWDKDADTSGEAKLWQDAMKRPRKSVPWLLVSNGKTGYEGPLPGDLEAMLTLLKKYGGE